MARILGHAGSSGGGACRWGGVQTGRGARRPLVSVVIPTYQRKATLLACLDALAGQTVGADALEAIVVDDGGSDGTGAALAARTWPFPLHALRQRNAGPAAARNRGLARARAPMVLFLNDDTLLAPDAVARHLEVHEAHRGDDVMVLGSFDFVPSFDATPLGHVLQRTTHLFQFVMLEPGATAAHDFAYTCNLSLPTADARAAGFDESFTGPAGEDIDFGLRLAQRGYVVRYEPSAASLHDHHMTVRSLARSARTRGYGQATYVLKHGLDPRHIGPLRQSARDLQRAEVEAEAVTAEVDAAFAAAGPTWPGSLPDRTYLALQRMMSLQTRLGALAHPDARRLVA